MDERTKEFLRKFFGKGNLLKYEDLFGPESEFPYQNELSVWVERLEKKQFPVILPCITSEGLSFWYGLSFSGREHRELKELLMGAIADSYSDFSGIDSLLDSGNASEEAIRSYFGFQYGYKFSANSKDDIPKVWESLSLMERLLRIRPERNVKQQRPTGRILRDFKMALETKNEPKGVACIEELRNEGRLSFQNLLFLKIQLFRSLRMFQEMLALPELTVLLELRRPKGITDALLEAVYHSKVRNFEQSADHAEILTYYKENILPKYPSLFLSRSALRSSESLKLFILHDLCETPPNLEKATQIIEKLPPDIENLEIYSSLIEESSSKVAPKESLQDPSILERARNLYFESKFDEAMDCLLQCLISPEVVQTMLRCASDIMTMESAKATFSAIEKLNEDDKNHIVSNKIFSGLLEKIRPLTEEVPDRFIHFPDNWHTWISLLLEDRYVSDASALAERGLSEWEAFSTVEEAGEFAEKILEANESLNQDQLHNSIPDLVNFFSQEGECETKYKRIYHSILLLLACADSQNEDDLSVAFQLGNCLLKNGLMADEYQEVRDFLETMWRNVESPRFFDWAVEILDLLIFYPCSDPVE